MPRVNDHSYVIRDEIELPLPQPQSIEWAIPNTPSHLNQAEVDRILASYGRVTATDARRVPPPQQPLDFDPNNLTISERVGLNDMGIHRPRYYKRTGDKS
jgi:hypothetical protein